ncbi:MAG: superoxide dismutase, Fe-Mn family [Acetobacteraceae bacterium]|nr:superoxide dismutase, Fe-Mn family [Acetobacteraceae bacterium]
MLAMLRRTTLFAGTAAIVLPRARRIAAQTTLASSAPVSADPSYPFVLPPLPYAPSANEPHIDTQTMELHHDKHHAAYAANLNEAVKDHLQVAAMTLTQILAKLNELPDTIRTAVRNNGGGHAYHSMFWTVMGGKGGDPDGDLATAIARDFGSIAQLKVDFNKAGLGQFGSGWAVVVVDGDGKLSLVARPNQDSPLMDGKRVLFGNDVWEHAYYLKYQNRRADYLAAWWNVVNWPVVAARYKAAIAGTLWI